jgi:site-specific DNA recombinase
VLCTTPDRLARNYVHQMVVLEELARRGCPVYCIDRPLSDDPHEQLILQVRSAVAEYERTVIVDRLRCGRQTKLRSGRLLPWTRPPYGYRVDPERPRDPDGVRIATADALIVEELFASYARGEATLNALAQRLTRRQVPSPTGQEHWRVSSIRGLLTNPVYMGLAAAARWESVPAQTRRSPLQPVGDGRSERLRSAEAWIRIPVPAIVSNEQFELVQQRLAKNRQGARRNTKGDYLLRGLVSCGVCRLGCTGRANPSDQPRYAYYVCRGKREPVSGGCKARYIPVAELDAVVGVAIATGQKTTLRQRVLGPAQRT